MRYSVIRLLGLCMALALTAHGETHEYEGMIVQDVAISCVQAEELAALLRKRIVIQAGDPFSQAQIRESIRNIYALKQFSQIEVTAEHVDGGLRLVFCPRQVKTISNIQIMGHKALTAERIRDILDVQIGDQIPERDLKMMEQRVLNVYRNTGYHQVQLTLQLEDIGPDKAVLTLNIQEGSPSKIGSVTFQGQTVFKEEELIKISKLKIGATFTLDLLEEGIKAIQQRYREEGYLHVDVADKDVQYDYATGEAALKINLSEGKPTRIQFEGNTHIAEKKLRPVVEDIFMQQAIDEEGLDEKAAALTTYYKDQGFPFVSVAHAYTEQEEAFAIIFQIQEGLRVRVQQVTFEGNTAFSSDELRDTLFTQPGGLFSKGWYRENVLEEDLMAIKMLYHQNGYLEADVSAVQKEFITDHTTGQTSVALRLTIKEGVQTCIEQVEILGEDDETFLKRLRKQLLFQEGAPLNVAEVSTSIERIRELYANQGYIKAGVDVATSFSDDNRLVTLHLHIDRGIKFFIGRISIQGIVNTKQVFIERELQVEEGDVYNPQEIRETVRRLLQLGFYENVTFRRLDPKSNNPSQDMLLAVQETSAKDIEFGGGYSTETEFKGFVEYSDKNLFNYGGRGTVRAEASIERPKLTLQYRHPHLFTQDTSLIASIFDDLKKDNASFDIERRGGRFALHHRFDPTLSTSLGYYFVIADPSGVKKDAVLSDLDTAIIHIGGLDYRILWDFRNDVIQPTRGAVMQAYLRLADTHLASDVNFWEVNAQANWYVPLIADVVLACSLNGNLIEARQASEVSPIYTRYFLGGENSVRGFQKDAIGPIGEEHHHIGGNRLALISTELRFPLYSVLGGVVFADVGANWLEADGVSAEDFRESIGAGVRVTTPVGPLRLDYGWKLDRQSGESAGEFHFAIGTAF